MDTESPQKCNTSKQFKDNRAKSVLISSAKFKFGLNIYF